MEEPLPKSKSITKVDASGGLVALDRLAKNGVQPDADFSSVFSWVFIAAALCLAAALVCLAGIEERPLRGPAPTPPAGSREAAPGLTHRIF